MANGPCGTVNTWLPIVQPPVTRGRWPCDRWFFILDYGRHRVALAPAPSHNFGSHDFGRQLDCGEFGRGLYCCQAIHATPVRDNAAPLRIPRVPVAETDANPLDARLPFGAAQPKASTPASPIAVHHQPERFAAYGALAHH
ncbi:conserved hypothetical protein [Mycobacterium ulcerans Agy99]|uniref:Uncharacterized protein n=1 Tax=Mycobacterium ulcerans (strain Agy99) TaxID=362242 RepID=A0PMI5_MYCUA|nr:conserved hypothetical protein [Mycobacterium ulcerans Agy99]